MRPKPWTPPIRSPRFRDRFAIPDPTLLYMDGNSLGRPPQTALEALTSATTGDWARDLVRSWRSRWMDLPTYGGDLIARLVGARDGEVVMSDQTSVNLYKLASAAVTARPGATAIVTESTNFPSDLYVLRGIADAHGLDLRVVPSGIGGTTAADLAAASEGAALVSLSHVGYKTSAINDMAGITAAAHAAGALMLWDLSHSVGIVPIDLAGSRADLAVGCTYKYLNAGPGAPAFLFVRSDLQAALRQPIQGWFGHPDMFAFASDYEAAPDIRRFTVGTPPILALVAAIEGIRVSAGVGIDAIRSKSIALTQLLIALFNAWPEPLGFELGSPRDPKLRGGHVSLRHPMAEQVWTTLIDHHNVVPDFRTPDSIRFGLAPLYTRFTDVWDAMDRTRKVGLSL